MAAKRAHRSINGLARLARGRSLAALALGTAALTLAGCGGNPTEPAEVVLAEDDATQVDEPDLEVDPREIADARATLNRVPGATATPIDKGIFSGGSGGSGDSFGFRSDDGDASSGIGIGGGSSGGGLGGGTSFGSSNATSGGSDALRAAGDAVAGAGRAAAGAGSDLAASTGVGASDLADAARSTPAGAAATGAAAAGGGDGESFGFRSDGGDNSESGSFGFRSDGGGDAPVPQPRSGGTAAGSAIGATPGAISVPSGGGSEPGIASGGEGFGQRVDQPTSRLPKSFGYAGPPRPSDEPVSGGSLPAATPAATAPSSLAIAGAPVAAPPQSTAVDTPLPPISPTLPPVGSGGTPAPVAGTPAPRGAEGLLFGCAPAGRPKAKPRLRMVRSGPTGVRSVAFVCLPAGVRPRFDGWRNRAGVTRITQTSDAGDIYEVPASLARRRGLGLPANVLARNPELRALPEPVTAFRGFTAVDATVSRLVRRPRATFAEITPAALARVPAADLNRVGRGAWADIRVRDLRKLPSARWAQIDRRIVAAVPRARRNQLSPAARRSIASRGL